MRRFPELAWVVLILNGMEMNRPNWMKIRQSISSKHYLVVFSLLFMIAHGIYTTAHPEKLGSGPFEDGIRRLSLPLRFWCCTLDGVFFLVAPFLVSALLAWLVYLLCYLIDRKKPGSKAPWSLLAIIYTIIIGIACLGGLR